LIGSYAVEKKETLRRRTELERREDYERVRMD
jgi:hypothetical protein